MAILRLRVMQLHVAAKPTLKNGKIHKRFITSARLEAPEKPKRPSLS
jgi:hypothetical protein